MTQAEIVLVRVVAPGFVAGLEVNKRTHMIVNAAPILRQIVAKNGWQWDWVRVAIRRRRGWKFEVL